MIALRAVLSLRVSTESEVSGIDVTEHGEEAYHDRDLRDLTGRRTSLGDAVLLPANELYAGWLARE